MAGINIDILANVRDFLRGAKQSEDALDDVADSLDELARDGQKAGDKLGDKLTDGLRDATRDAERQADKIGDAVASGVADGTDAAGDDVDKLERKFKDLAAATKRGDLNVGDGIAESAKKGTREAASATGEFKDEALSNFSEVTSSFQGDMTSITDLAQGTFGGLASMGGPASLVFGGVAVAVGLIGQALVASGEDSDEFKEKIRGLADTKLGDLLGEYGDSGDELARGLRKWATDADSFGGSISDLRKNTKEAKLPFGELAAAIGSQSVPKMKELRREIEAHIKSLDKQAGAQRAAGNGSSALANQLGEQSDAAGAVKKQLDENLKVNDQFEKSLAAVAKAQGMTVAQYKASLDATVAYDDSVQALADTMTNVLGAAAEATSDAIDNSAADPQAYIDGLNERLKAAENYRDNVKAIGEELPGDLMNFVREQGEGFSQEIATYLSASPEQKQQIQDGWRIAAQVDGDTTDLDNTTKQKGKERNKGPTSEVRGDTTDLDEKVKRKGTERKPGPVSEIRADDSAVDAVLRRLKERTEAGPTVKLAVDQSSVDSALRSLRNTTIRIPVKAVP